MGRHLILIKHSLPAIVENIPAREWVLSKEGRSLAKKLAQRLIQYHPEVIVSSTEPKARETAEIIARSHKIKCQAFDGLHEHDRSKTSFLSKDEFIAAVRGFFEKPNTLVFGSETANQCHARFDRAVRSVLDLYVDKKVAIVAHGTVISLFTARLLGLSDFTLWNELGLPSFVVIDMHSRVLIAKENIS